MKKLTLRIYRNKRREYAWTLIGANGEKLCPGQGYSRRIDMESTINLIFLGRVLSMRSKSIQTLLAFREDIRLEDLTTPKASAKTRCKGKRCK